MVGPRLHITEAESEILAALWRHGSLTPRGLIEAVSAAQPWGDATIKTLLGRLMRKKAICSERDAGRLTYRAMVDRETYIDGEVQALVDRLFGSRREDLVDFIRRGS
ncbi:BlaI/MecI/CopY family transcriptional regulator [Brevundimonas sp.]|jgi:BlaI family penicillinase repressor|uniref:BlaI/MecI/CopY family transcriptional regulator n=1 Tax=Brevundimonas sp. TaxID=1871086 RepID=UPI003918798E|nr:BlaI/MecI/CopY family transcriptional regulator [Brevundimonas sp.]MCA3717736.1 BlaI/MecI/CopY family transcriptional regulator [Brevundimonas sp.]